jgi:MFS family permease
LLALTSLFADVASEMLYPILPIFLTQELGASAGVIGLIEGVAQATQYISQGLSGFVSDKLRRRKSIALLGYSVSAIAKPLIGFSASWVGALGARAVDRLGAGTRCTEGRSRRRLRVRGGSRESIRARGRRRQSRGGHVLPRRISPDFRGRRPGGYAAARDWRRDGVLGQTGMLQFHANASSSVTPTTLASSSGSAPARRSTPTLSVGVERERREMKTASGPRGPARRPSTDFRSAQLQVPVSMFSVAMSMKVTPVLL